MSQKRNRLAAAVRSALGFVVGALMWAGGAGAYHAVLAIPAQASIRAFERPSVTRLSAAGKEILVDREDFPESSPRPGVPASDLDFNIAILTALFAASPRPFRDRNLGRLLVAAMLLAGTHVVAVVFKVEAIYALDLGPWSRAHYGPVARNFWAAGAHFYRIAGIFAVPFVLWWAGTRWSASARPGRRPARRR